MANEFVGIRFIYCGSRLDSTVVVNHMIQLESPFSFVRSQIMDILLRLVGEWFSGWEVTLMVQYRSDTGLLPPLSFLFRLPI